MREVAIVPIVVWSIVLWIRPQSRIMRKYDLETAKICCGNDRFLSKITLRLWAERKDEKLGCVNGEGIWGEAEVWLVILW